MVAIISVLSDLSLTLQIVAFLMILYSIKLKKEGLEEHGRAASLAAYVMIPSILFMFYSISLGLSLPDYEIVIGLHRLLGAITLVFIGLFVTNQWKFKKKVHMDIAIISWVVTFGLGLGVYALSS